MFTDKESIYIKKEIVKTGFAVCVLFLVWKDRAFEANAIYVILL